LSVRPTASLEAIGLDDARRAEVAAFGEDCTPARVTRIDRGAAQLCTPTGEARVATFPATTSPSATSSRSARPVRSRTSSSAPGP